VRKHWIQLLAIGICLSACASRYAVKTYPEGAKVAVQNVISKETFEVGEAPVEFEHLSKFGEGFVVKVEKEAFEPKEFFVARQPGAKAEYQVNLKPIDADPNAKTGDDKKAEEEMKERLALLERTFEIYKDALFSQRYGSSPASYDRRKIDLSVGLVSKAQQLIEQRKLDEADQTLDQILEKDAYLVQAHVLKGSVAYLKNDYPAAIRAWERALEINPYEKLTRQYLVSAYEKIGKEVPVPKDELDMVDRIPASSPLSPDPLNLRLKNR
jgi:tetratricopeptide (TPR) repeat protein